MTDTPFAADPALDLVLEREVDVPPELVWEAWTKPEHVKEWFAPKPWEIAECEIDLRPGGAFRTVMRSPEGEEFPGSGCFLEVVPNERLTWTSALGPDFRPAGSSDPSDLPFTAVIELRPTASGGTHYRAIALHQDEEARTRHAEMGFVEGWGASLDQLVVLAETLRT
jgi:uncharacterized protein YndB with AHSA1/START domain